MNCLLVTTLVGVVLFMNGCYYSHLASGQLKILWHRQPIAEATADADHSEQTRELLGLVESVRVFAADLGLDVDGQYTSYVDWPGDRIVTTLVRTRPGSLEAVPYWFLFVGELPYKGYFDRIRAEAEADRLRTDEGFDVCVSPITAYSTLGWVDDPVTTPMLLRGAAAFVETLLHEFVHSTAFLEDDADFNESVAQFIGQQAAIRFFESHPPGPESSWPDADRVRRRIEERWAINRVVSDFRDRLLSVDVETRRGAWRAGAEREARLALSALPLREYSAERVAETARLSDACLALRGTYTIDLPRHAALLAAMDGDLPAMIARLERWAEEGWPSDAFFVLD